MRKLTFGGLIALVLALPVAAQLPQYFVTPAVKPGGKIQLALVGQPGHPFVSLIDLSGGPGVFLGEELFLGLSPSLTLLDAGTFGVGGLRVQSIGVPAAGVPVGVVFYMQSLVLDSQAPNGTFRPSNGESTALYASTQVMVEEFSDPVLQGYTGTYDKTRRHRLMGGAISRRVHTVRYRQGTPFTLPMYGPLNPDGARVQMVYRAGDLGGAGNREVLTALRWLPFGKVTQVKFKRLVIDVGHTRVVPDFTIDPKTSFPRFPASGLDVTFARNPKPGEAHLRIVDAAYSLRPADVRPDGYVNYPTPSKDFVYNGFDSLLLDFKMEATPGPKSPNGMRIQLMVLSSPQPNARVHNGGRSGSTVNPHTVKTGRGDNTMSYMQFEFTSVETFAQSPWRKSPVPSPDYHTPSIAKSVPVGTSILVEYRGADSATGTGAIPWGSNVNFVDRKLYLQYRITLVANPRTGAVPSLEAIVIPIN